MNKPGLCQPLKVTAKSGDKSMRGPFVSPSGGRLYFGVLYMKCWFLVPRKRQCDAQHILESSDSRSGAAVEYIEIECVPQV